MSYRRKSPKLKTLKRKDFGINMSYTIKDKVIEVSSNSEDKRFMLIGDELININSIHSIVKSSVPNLHYKLLYGPNANDFIKIETESDADKIKKYLLGEDLITL